MKSEEVKAALVLLGFKENTGTVYTWRMTLPGKNIGVIYDENMGKYGFIKQRGVMAGPEWYYKTDRLLVNVGEYLNETRGSESHTDIMRVE